jgi:hypothetical protein
MSKDDKAERLAAQLRENLRRRKTQARAVELDKALACPERKPEGL